MNGDKLLSRIHKNAQMGLFTVPIIAELTHDGDFRRTLRMQQTEYKNIYYSAERLTPARTLPYLSSFAQKRTKAMIKISSLVDRSASHFAEMMIMGSTRGVIDLQKALMRYPNAPRTSRELAKTLLEVEENNIGRLKQYL